MKFRRFGNRATGHRDFARDLLVDHLIARRVRSADKQRLSSHRYAGFGHFARYGFRASFGARGRRAFWLEDYVFCDRRACGSRDAVSLENFTAFAKPPRGLSCEFADACKALYTACFVSADVFDRRCAFYDI